MFACYSGRGGEEHDPGMRTWKSVPKEVLKQEFKKSSSRIKILLGTEALSEGLNLQAASAIVNYDMPWNPMRVEQRIGRIDRIGQTAARITVRNYFYRGTIEDQIYHVLGERHNLFREVVGETPAILAMIHEAIKEGVAVPEDERLTWVNKKREEIRREFARLEEDRIILENMAVPAFRGEPPSEPPVTPEDLEAFFTESPLTRHLFSKEAPELFRLSLPRDGLVTFDPKTADEKIESVTYLSYGSDLFQELLDALPKAESIPEMQAGIVRITVRNERESVAYVCNPGASGLGEIMNFQQLSLMVGEKNDLGPLTAKDLSELASTVKGRVETAIEREREALESYEAGRLTNLRAECKLVLDNLVAIEMAKHEAFVWSETNTDTPGAGMALRKLLKKRVDRVPALIEAAEVDVERYVLPPEIAARYAGKREEVLDGSKGPLVKRADALLQSIRLLIDEVGRPRQKSSLETSIDGLV